jgi:hypothetical protein
MAKKLTSKVYTYDIPNFVPRLPLIIRVPRPYQFLIFLADVFQRFRAFFCSLSRRDIEMPIWQLFVRHVSVYHAIKLCLMAIEVDEANEFLEWKFNALTSGSHQQRFHPL